MVGSNPNRYSAEMGNERHKELTADDVDGICRELELEIFDAPKQTKKDAAMIKLGRDHRTGVGMWDSSDLHAVVRALEDGGADGG